MNLFRIICRRTIVFWASMLVIASVAYVYRQRTKGLLSTASVPFSKSVHFFMNDSAVVSASDTRLYVFRLEGSQLKYWKQVDVGEKISVTGITPDARVLIVGTDQGQIILFETTSWNRLKSVDVFDKGVRQIAASPEGHYFAASNYEGAVSVWETKSMRLVLERDFSGKLDVDCISFLSPHSLLIAGGDMTEWNIVSNETVALFPDEYLSCREMDVSAQGTIAIGGGDVTILSKDGAIYRADTPGGMMGLRFSANGEILALGTLRASPVSPFHIGNLGIYRGGGFVFSSRCVAVADLDISADGRLIVVAGTNGKIELWDVNKHFGPP